MARRQTPGLVDFLPWSVDRETGETPGLWRVGSAQDKLQNIWIDNKTRIIYFIFFLALKDVQMFLIGVLSTWKCAEPHWEAAQRHSLQSGQCGCRGLRLGIRHRTVESLSSFSMIFHIFPYEWPHLDDLQVLTVLVAPAKNIGTNVRDSTLCCDFSPFFPKIAVGIEVNQL